MPHGHTGGENIAADRLVVPFNELPKSNLLEKVCAPPIVWNVGEFACQRAGGAYVARRRPISEEIWQIKKLASREKGRVHAFLEPKDLGTFHLKLFNDASGQGALV